MTVIFTQAVTYRHSLLHPVIFFLFFCLEEKVLLHTFLITRQKTLDSTGKVNTNVKQKNLYFFFLFWQNLYLFNLLIHQYLHLTKQYYPVFSYPRVLNSIKISALTI